MLQLRPYQSESVHNIRRSFVSFPKVLFALPTGGGKTVIFSYIVSNAILKNKKILILAHRVEIVEQISKALIEFGINHGLLMPGEKQTYDDVQLGMVQTIARRLHTIHPPDFIVIDEAHLAVAGTWLKVIAAFPDAKILGVTATPQRLDGKGLKLVFDDLVIGPTVRELIEGGYLSRFDLYAPPTEIDLSGVKTQMGDYSVKQLEAVMDKAKITGNAVSHYQKYLNNQPAIAFCTTLKHAVHVMDQFRSSGIRSDIIHGKLNKFERSEKVRGLSNGDIQVLTSVEVVSEGFDLPVVSGAILLRPTKSLTLYLQQVGRALRPKPNGGRAIILDHVGNVHRHGMPDEDRAWSLEGKVKKTTRGPRQCSQCYRVFYSKPPCSDPECPMDRDPVSKTAPKVVDGELKAMQDPYSWAKGINIATACGEEWKSLLHHAEGRYDRLKQIQVLRGYKPQWIRHQIGDHKSARWSNK